MKSPIKSLRAMFADTRWRPVWNANAIPPMRAAFPPQVAFLGGGTFSVQLATQTAAFARKMGTISNTSAEAIDSGISSKAARLLEVLGGHVTELGIIQRDLGGQPLRAKSFLLDIRRACAPAAGRVQGAHALDVIVTGGAKNAVILPCTLSYGVGPVAGPNSVLWALVPPEPDRRKLFNQLVAHGWRSGRVPTGARLGILVDQSLRLSFPNFDSVLGMVWGARAEEYIRPGGRISPAEFTNRLAQQSTWATIAVDRLPARKRDSRELQADLANTIAALLTRSRSLATDVETTNGATPLVCAYGPFPGGKGDLGPLRSDLALRISGLLGQEPYLSLHHFRWPRPIFWLVVFIPIKAPHPKVDSTVEVEELWEAIARIAGANTAEEIAYPLESWTTDGYRPLPVAGLTNGTPVVRPGTGNGRNERSNAREHTRIGHGGPPRQR